MPEGDGIKCNIVISGGVYLGNDTSHASCADNFVRNRGEAFVQPFSNKRLRRLLESLRPRRIAGAFCRPALYALINLW